MWEFHLQYLLYMFKDSGKQMIVKIYPSPGTEFNLNSGSLCFFQVKTIGPHNSEIADSDKFMKLYNGIHLDSLIFIYYHVLINSVFDT